ncbi:MAG: transposase [Armatimonadetes bacterium]|nr:transposase [Armatimonadota bacterium]
MDAERSTRVITWPHQPPHVFEPNRHYIVTGATYQKARLFRSADERNILLATLLGEAEAHEWRLEAWAVFSNHYHFVGISPEKCDLTALIRSIHSKSAREINRIHSEPGCQVWWQYWDTIIGSDKALYARLHYVHANPVRHGYQKHPRMYRWCSYAWMEQGYPDSYVKTVTSFKYDLIRVPDDF